MLISIVLSDPLKKTGSNGLPPPDEPLPGGFLGLSLVCVALAGVSDDVVVGLGASVELGIVVDASTSLDVLSIVVELSVLVDVDVAASVVDELSVVLSTVVVVDISVV
jgi:hypothetical protein